MSAEQFVLLALVALAVTVPIVKLIPRARQSRWFDRVLWIATWLLAFVGAWYAVGQLKTTAPLATMSWDAFARTAGASIALGALGGALALNLVLWLMDRVIPLTAEGLDDEHADDVPSQSSES
ncbi:MAG: hypothetical protein N2559_11140 [Anaerolineae bacterium]|nr:hypothetical protein [Anaerolineae bacterium]